MPPCNRGCNNDCNCLLYEDGFWGGRPDLGRNFSRVKGAGTPDSPFEISFLDQREFRPRTAEFQIDSTNLPDEDTVSTLVAGPGTSTILYQSPINFILKDPLMNEDYKYIAGNFFVFGATVTFAPVPSGTPANGRALILSNIRTNISLLTENQASLESGTTTGWVNDNNATLTASTDFASAGIYSLKMQAIGAGTMSATTLTGKSGQAVNPNTEYTALARFRAGTTGRSCNVSIVWYNSVGDFISTSTGANIADSAGPFTQAVVTATSPSNAAFAAVLITVISPSGSEIHYMDRASLAPGSSTVWTLPTETTTAVMAGHTTRGSTTDSLTLSCEALWAGTFTYINSPGVSGQINNAFSVHVVQRSASPILLTDIRVWMTEV